MTMRRAILSILLLSFSLVLVGVVLNQWWVLVSGIVVGLFSGGFLDADHNLGTRLYKKVTNWPGGWW
jgi:hypothetical protein